MSENRWFNPMDAAFTARIHNKSKFAVPAKKKFKQLSFDFEHYKFKRKLQEIKIDIKKFTKMKNLKSMAFQWLGTDDDFVPCRVLNFKDIVKFKKLKNFSCPFKQISFEEFRAVKLFFQNEKYEDPTYYDEEYAYLEEEDKKKGKVVRSKKGRRDRRGGKILRRREVGGRKKVRRGRYGK